MKRRKGYQVKKGHIQKYTLVKFDKFKKLKATSTKKKDPDIKKKSPVKKKKEKE